jgi:hypothetical protein
MAAAVAAPPRLGLATGSLPHAGVPLLYIAAGTQEVGLWDVLDGRCHQVGRTAWLCTALTAVHLCSKCSTPVFVLPSTADQQMLRALG